MVWWVTFRAQEYAVTYLLWNGHAKGISQLTPFSWLSRAGSVLLLKQHSVQSGHGTPLSAWRCPVGPEGDLAAALVGRAELVAEGELLILRVSRTHRPNC